MCSEDPPTPSKKKKKKGGEWGGRHRYLHRICKKVWKLKKLIGFITCYGQKGWVTCERYYLYSILISKFISVFSLSPLSQYHLFSLYLFLHMYSFRKKRDYHILSLILISVLPQVTSPKVEGPNYWTSGSCLFVCLFFLIKKPFWVLLSRSD